MSIIGMTTSSPRCCGSSRRSTVCRSITTVFDSNNTLEARLLAGHSGYDVVFPSGAYLESMITAGVFRPLDKALLPNLKYLDPAIMQRLAAHDPGNAHAVDYTWGITGLLTTRRRFARVYRMLRWIAGRCCSIRGCRALRRLWHRALRVAEHHRAQRARLARRAAQQRGPR